MASNAGARIDEIRRMYRDGVVNESTARDLAAPLILAMNRKKIKRERSSGREPKLFTFDQLMGRVYG